MRGLAILLVVACHINLPFAAGGYVGVDIFFVLSGFLITRQLLAQHRACGTVSLTDFYARRVRRLLPALVLVVVATLGAGVFLLLPDEQVALGKSAAAAMLFAANIHFWSSGGGYFEPASALIPLQHLWTLGVEEQFYILWPLAVAGIAGVSRRHGRGFTMALGVFLITILVLSLGLSAGLGGSRAAFFLIPARAWELAAGCLLALAPPFRRQMWWLAPLGGLTVAVSVLAFDAGTPFPSFHAILPVLGATMLIAGGTADPRGLVCRALSGRWIVGLGRVSYGWYLWHWPLLAFARIQWGGGPLARDAGLVLLALLLAVAMHRWVEMPVRTRRTPGFRSIWGSIGSGVALLGVGLSLSAALWAWGARPYPSGSLMAQYKAARGGAVRDFPFCGGAAPCGSGARRGSAAILLWGDSHAAQLGRALDIAGRQAGVRVLTRTAGYCPPGGSPAGVGTGDKHWIACASFNARVRGTLPELRRSHNLRMILFAGGWDAGQAGWDRQLAAEVDAARKLGLSVILARDVPLHGRGVLRCAVRYGAEACTESRDRIDARALAADRAIDAIAARRPGVMIWSPRDTLCGRADCPAAINGQLLYRNQGHLTLAGSERLAPALLAVLNAGR